MHKPEYILENVTYKILWDIEIQINHQIPVRRPGQVLINITVNHTVKINESENLYKELHHARELKKVWNMILIKTIS